MTSFGSARDQQRIENEIDEELAARLESGKVFWSIMRETAGKTARPGPRRCRENNVCCCEAYGMFHVYVNVVSSRRWCSGRLDLLQIGSKGIKPDEFKHEKAQI